jgi:DNA-binding MarR family transcriptional regulator
MRPASGRIVEDEDIVQFLGPTARVRGRNGGRPKKLSPKELKTIRTLLRSNEVPVRDIAAQFKVNRSTLYRNMTAT